MGSRREGVPTAEPLAAHRLFRTSDLDEAREQVAQVFCPHRLDLCGGDAHLDTVHNSARLHDVSLNYLDYGAAVRITPGELGTFFLVQMPLQGSAEINCGGEQVVSTPVLASVPSPFEHLDMQWARGTSQMLVQIDRAALERVLWEILGYEGSRPLRFELGLDLRSEVSATWRRAVRLLGDEIDDHGALASQPVARRELEHLVMTALLVGHRSNYSELLEAPLPPAPARAVRRAVEFCECHADQPIDVAALARAAGTSVRSLQAGFRSHLGTTPMAYLRDIRLRRVHDELRVASPGEVRVAEVAMAWGFTNLGRFSRNYRECFGELPRETLRGEIPPRRRGRHVS